MILFVSTLGLLCWVFIGIFVYPAEAHGSFILWATYGLVMLGVILRWLKLLFEMG